MSRPWRDKYPIRSLRGDGDDERFEAFACWQPAAMRRRPAPDRDGAEVDRRHRAKQLALARRAARRERRRLAGSALVAEPTGVVRKPLRSQRQTDGRRQMERVEQRRAGAGYRAERAEWRYQSQWGGRSSSPALDTETASQKRHTHSTGAGYRKNGGRPHSPRRHS